MPAAAALTSVEDHIEQTIDNPTPANIEASRLIVASFTRIGSALALAAEYMDASARASVQAGRAYQANSGERERVFLDNSATYDELASDQLEEVRSELQLTRKLIQEAEQ